ncbi:Conserved_hypothetical protein [Hexamita inflata]|uniref:Uncharacterized protein n=1 Tax=Hexamita inflata TaxID=28002 RepID=A0AA86RLB4_9EUKA|nr:Conserved hypothetical protein [Hexamita inflata]
MSFSQQQKLLNVISLAKTALSSFYQIILSSKTNSDSLNDLKIQLKRQIQFTQKQENEQKSNLQKLLKRKPDYQNLIDYRIQQNESRIQFNSVLYKQCFKDVFGMDYKQHTAIMLCEQIDALNRVDNLRFWTHVKCMLQQKQTISQLKTYYKQSFKRVQATKFLTDEDRHTIENFCQNNLESTNIEIINQLLEENLYLKEYFYQDIYQVISSYVFKHKNKTTLNHKQKMSQEKLVQAVQMYKQCLLEVFNIDCSEYDHNQLNQQILKLDPRQSVLFWKCVQKNKNPRQRLKCLQEYFNVSFQRSFFTEHLTDQDKLYIRQYCLSHDNIPVQQTEQIMKDYIKDRDIHFYEVHYYIAQIHSKCQQSQNILKSQVSQYFLSKSLKQDQSWTTIYQSGLQYIQIVKQDEILTNQQICNHINSLNKTQRNQFWKYLTLNVRPCRTVNSLQAYYRHYYQRALYDDQLTQNDKMLIKQYCAIQCQLQHSKKYVIRISQQIINIYFRDRNIFPQDITMEVRKYFSGQISKMNQNLTDEEKSNNKQIKKMKSLKQQEHNISIMADFYKKALSEIQIHYDDTITPEQQSDVIDSLSKHQLVQFWKALYSIIQPQRIIEVLKQQYNQIYKQILYKYRLNSIDKQYIQQYCDENYISMSQIDITNKLMQNYFRDKNIFFYEVLRQVQYSHQKLVKEKLFEQKEVTTINALKQHQENVLRQDAICYQTSLKQLLNNDFSAFTNQELCEQINQLDESQSKNFWKIVQQVDNTRKLPYKQKQHYLKTFQQVMYTDHLTDDDKQYITKICDENITDQETKELTRSNLPSELMSTYFKDRRIFDVEVTRFIINLTNRKYQFQNYEDKNEILHKEYTVLYQNALEELLDKTFSNHTPKQLCSVIDSLNEKQQLNIMRFVKNNNTFGITRTDQLRYYYDGAYKRQLYNYKLTEDDLIIIDQQCDNQIYDTKANAKQITSETIKKYFKDKDVLEESVFNRVVSILKSNKRNQQIKK